MHEAEHRHAVFDEGDADAELAVLLDELARAVERIDQPQPRPGTALGRVQRGGFLRQYRDVRRQRFQASDQQAMRGEIRLGQRRAVVLGFNGEIPGIDGHDRAARRLGQRDGRGTQGGVAHRGLRGIRS